MPDKYGGQRAYDQFSPSVTWILRTEFTPSVLKKAGRSLLPEPSAQPRKQGFETRNLS